MIYTYPLSKKEFNSDTPCRQCAGMIFDVRSNDKLFCEHCKTEVVAGIKKPSLEKVIAKAIEAFKKPPSEKSVENSERKYRLMQNGYNEWPLR